MTKLELTDGTGLVWMASIHSVFSFDDAFLVSSTGISQGAYHGSFFFPSETSYKKTPQQGLFIYFQVLTRVLPAPQQLVCTGNGSALEVSVATGWSEVGTLALVERGASVVVAHAVLQKLEPGASQVAEPQDTMLDNCMALSPTLRVRWTVNSELDNVVDIGLEGVHHKTLLLVLLLF